MAWRAEARTDPCWGVEVGNLQKRPPHFRAAQARSCKHAHVWRPQVLHSVGTEGRGQPQTAVRSDPTRLRRNAGQGSGNRPA